MAQQEEEAVFDVVEVAQQGGESEQHHGHGDEDGADGAEGLGQGLLDEGSAGDVGVGLNAGAQAHESGGGAQQQGVDEDGQHLHQALLGGMGNVGGSGGVRSGTDTGFVGVEAALEAHHQAGTHEAAEDGLEVEGVGEDHAEHMGDVADVDGQSDQSHQHVGDTHDGDQGAGDLDDALAAAQQAVESQQGDDGADDDRGDAFLIEGEAGERRLQVVGGQHVVAHAVGEDQGEAEDDGQGTAVQRGLDVVGGAAVGAAFMVALLVDLGQSGFHESGSAAQNGGDPHPEHGAGAAHAQGGGHADDVAGAHAGGGGDHQSAEGGDGAFGGGLFTDHTDGFLEQAELGELGPDGEIEAAAEQQQGQRPAGQIKQKVIH